MLKIENGRYSNIVRNIIVLVSFTVTFIIVLLYIFYFKNNIEKYDGDVLFPTEYVFFDKNRVFTCTGLTYNFNTKEYYIGNYGKSTPDDNTQEVSIIVCNDKFDIIDEIIPSKDIKNIQGVSYCNKTNTIFFTDTEKIYEIDFNGNVLSNIIIENASTYKPNSILYDDRDDTLWVLCTSDYLFHINTSGEIIDKIECSFRNQDQICFDKNYNILFTVGADYNGTNNYVGLIDIKNRNAKIIYNVSDSYAVEGIFVKDDALYIINDGIFHDAKIRENYIVKYELDNGIE